MVSTILDNLAENEQPESIARAFQVSVEDVQAALEYAAELARE